VHFFFSIAVGVITYTMLFVLLFYHPHRRYLNYLFQRYDPHICVSTPCSTGRRRVGGGGASRVCCGSIGAAAGDVGAWRLAYATYSVLLLLLLRTPSENSASAAAEATATDLGPRRPPTRNAPGD